MLNGLRMSKLYFVTNVFTFTFKQFNASVLHKRKIYINYKPQSYYAYKTYVHLYYNIYFIYTFWNIYLYFI